MTKCKMFGNLLIICSLLIVLPVFSQAQEQNTVTYKNKALGVKLSAPVGRSAAGIRKQDLDKISKKTDISVLFLSKAHEQNRVLVQFGKYPYVSSVEYNPLISLQVIPLLPEYNIKTVQDAANIAIPGSRQSFKDFKLIKETTDITVNGNRGAYFIFEGIQVQGYLETKINGAFYAFLKNNMRYLVTFSDKSDDFAKNLKEAETSINSLSLTNIKIKYDRKDNYL